MTTEFPVMKGSARMARGAGYFEVPLFTLLYGNLWMGSSPAEFADELEAYNYDLYDYGAYRVARGMVGRPINCRWLLKDGQPRFDAILNLYQWGEYVLPEGTEQVTLTMYDGEGVDVETVNQAVDQVCEWLDEGKTVLVHCQAGLNRSSLVSALVLQRYYGFSIAQAIEQIRERRSPTCLCNEDFENYLRSLT
jgi:hypothetical protein